MCQHKVLLISSDDIGWADLRTTLQAMRDVCIVGEATCADQAIQRSTLYQPNLIISAATVDGISVAPLLNYLSCNLGSTCRIVVFAARCDMEDVVTLANIGIENFLLWPDLSSTTLSDCLTLILTSTIVVSSLTVAEARRIAQQNQSWAHLAGESVLLAPREQRVLKHLAAGLTREQIAKVEQVSLRTVKRIISTLGMKLEAPCPFVLGMKAAQLGWI